MPWQMAAGEDFRYLETEGKKASGTGLLNAYVPRILCATRHGPVLLAEFLKVMNLMQPPTSLMRPAILWRVLAGGRAGQAPAMPAMQPTSGD